LRFSELLRVARNDTRTLYNTQAVIARERSERGDPEKEVTCSIEKRLLNAFWWQVCNITFDPLPKQGYYQLFSKNPPSIPALCTAQHPHLYGNKNVMID